jgi:hypothetical protein
LVGAMVTDRSQLGRGNGYRKESAWQEQLLQKEVSLAGTSVTERRQLGRGKGY